jgi:fructose-1-phosphate kinase PfkB-like protein
LLSGHAAARLTRGGVRAYDPAWRVGIGSTLRLAGSNTSDRTRETPMTLIVGPNLSLDQTVAVPRLRVGTIHRVPEVLRLAGGKGGNVARALAILGGEPLLCGFAGGPVGRLVEANLVRDGVPHRLVATAGETRICFSVADDASGEQTEFYEAGSAVTVNEVAALLAAVEACLADQRWVVITGSLPPGAPDDLYATLIERAHRAGARTLLDAKGRALAAGLEAGPDVLKINRAELADHVGRELATPVMVAMAAAEVVGLPSDPPPVAGFQGASPRDGRPARAPGAVITLGAAGAVVAGVDGWWRVMAPPGAARSPVGSGDSAAAGVVLGLERGLGLREAARLGVAAGTANARHLGGARFTRGEAEAILAEVPAAPLARTSARGDG